LIPYTFAQDGEYDIQIYLARGYAGDIDGLKESQPHELTLLLDRTPIGGFTVQKPANGDDSLLDKNLKIRVPRDRRTTSPGRHVCQECFVADRDAAPASSGALQRTASSPSHAGDSAGFHHRTVLAAGRRRYAEPPEDLRLSSTSGRDEPATSRRSSPAVESSEGGCAKTVLSALMRRAYRRPISETDLERPMAFYREGRSEGDFDAGIGRALSAVLISP
jgi:hypothetical protein